jgi:hypothetical protein
MERVVLAMALLGFGTAAFADDPTQSNARTVADKYVAAALTGKADEAGKLLVTADAGLGTKKDVEEAKALFGDQVPKMSTVWVDGKAGKAIAVSEGVKVPKRYPDHPEKVHAYLVFQLTRTGDKWLIDSYVLRTDKRAGQDVKAFRKAHPDAAELPTGSGQ